MHVTGDACSWNSIIRCWVRMSQMITDPVSDILKYRSKQNTYHHLPSVPADAIHDPSGENLTEFILAICPRYLYMH